MVLQPEQPVQLQAVCYQMWQKLRDRPGATITVDDVEQYADVDTALINFYEDTIAKTVRERGVSEIDLRGWFERELITEARTRNMVFRGEEWAGELPTAVADHVREQFILREVVRPGGTWYELVHDRFVPPILAANLSVLPLPQDEEMEGPFARLSTLEVGGTARVVALSPVLRGPERRRMLDLGLIPGTEVTAEMRSPSGDPTGYRIRGAVIALRMR